MADIIKIEMKGIKELETAFKKYPKLTKTFINQAIYAYANESAKYARTQIRTGSRSGRIYMIKGKPHTASSPTEYPARITKGRGLKAGLHGSIHWKRIPGGAAVISDAVATRKNKKGKEITVHYSDYLEYGTSKIRGTQTGGGVTFKGGRPFMRPALQEKDIYLNKQIDIAMNKANTEAFEGGLA